MSQTFCHSTQKIMKYVLFVTVLVLSVMGRSEYAFASAKDQPLPEGFVYITDIVPDVLLDVRYYSTYNFVADRVDGYHAPVVVMSKEAAEALKKVNGASKERGFVLKVFDAYRPQTAVNHFVRWAEDLNDAKSKEVFYPQVDKSKLFEQGYIAAKSGHSRGSTVDLTLVDWKTGKELDMGSAFDFFGPVSHHGTTLITPEQTANREILKSLMEASGFRPYAEEWWHYTLTGEPHPETYFDFLVQ